MKTSDKATFYIIGLACGFFIGSVLFPNKACAATVLTGTDPVGAKIVLTDEPDRWTCGDEGSGRALAARIGTGVAEFGCWEPRLLGAHDVAVVVTWEHGGATVVDISGFKRPTP